jgi:hypothetical protein
MKKATIADVITFFYGGVAEKKNKTTIASITFFVVTIALGSRPR